MTTTTIPSPSAELRTSMERLSEVYAEHIGELGQLLEARQRAAEGLESFEASETLLKAHLRVAGTEGKNEDDRKANLLISLEARPDYQAMCEHIREVKSQRDTLDIAIELKRLRMRLAGWQMEWLIAQGPPAHVPSRWDKP